MKFSESKIKFIEETKEIYIEITKEYAKRATKNKDLLKKVLVEMESRGIEFWSKVPVGPRMNVKGVMNNIGKEIIEKRGN